MKRLSYWSTDNVGPLFVLLVTIAVLLAGASEALAYEDYSGCESCHGAGRRHLEDPERPFGKIGLSSCTVCHDPKNSPRFDYYSYIVRVNHQATR